MRLRLTPLAVVALAALISVESAQPTPGPAAVGCKAEQPWNRANGGPPEPRAVALMLADGPGPYDRPAAAILRARHVKATFALIGEQIAGQEPFLRRLLADGDVLANHSFTHSEITPDNAYAELERTQAEIRRATGYTPCVFRPPGGHAGRGVIAVARSLRMVTTTGVVLSDDWDQPGVDVIVQRTVGQAHPGAIILLHANEQTNEALPRIIDELREQHYWLFTVPRLLGLESRYAL